MYYVQPEPDGRYYGVYREDGDGRAIEHFETEARAENYADYLIENDADVGLPEPEPEEPEPEPEEPEPEPEPREPPVAFGTYHSDPTLTAEEKANTQKRAEEADSDGD